MDFNYRELLQTDPFIRAIVERAIEEQQEYWLRKTEDFCKQRLGHMREITYIEIANHLGFDRKRFSRNKEPREIIDNFSKQETERQISKVKSSIETLKQNRELVNYANVVKIARVGPRHISRTYGLKKIINIAK